MNARQVPEFDEDRANETTDAISLNIIQCLSHGFAYNNRGKDGWELLIRFSIKNYKQLTLLNKHENDFDVIEQEPFIVRRAVETDVPGIISLVYNTYRYSYAKEMFYNDVTLAQMIRENKIVSVVAVTESGTIVGHNAVLLDSPLLGEAGMSMVDPDYRKSKAFLSLTLFTARLIKTEYPQILAYTKCVTSHPRSQAFVTNFTSSMLQLSVYSHASFVGINGESNPRESLLYSLMNLCNDKTEKNIYTPNYCWKPCQEDNLQKLRSRQKVLILNLLYRNRQFTCVRTGL